MMSKIQRRVMERFYSEAQGDPTRLPWHDETPSPFLDRALQRASEGGRALDVGCGSGWFAAHMAAAGLRVTAIDYLPDAIDMARNVARERGVELEFVSSDALQYDATGFRLVFDSGCLHNMGGRELQLYRERLLRWLDPDGDFVLAHWGRRHRLDWRPIGPRRRTGAQLAELFAPELELVDSEWNDERVPFPFGPTVRMASYWFRRRA